MKEYIAETGGRYTYADDVLGLQELALSMTALFGECSDFILSGCEISGARIEPGYLWLGGKIRRFEGCVDATFPYYIYERNTTESVTYAKQVNKRGRVNYAAIGGASVPDMKDAVTGALPRYISLTAEYAPRLRDKFFGRYAVLLEPSGPQTIGRDLALLGQLTVEKQIESRSGVVVAGANGYLLRQKIKADGNASLGVWQGALLVAEIVIGSDGSFTLMRQGTELARITEAGIFCGTSSVKKAQAGALSIYGSHLINSADATDEGFVAINYSGFEQGTAHYRNFEVYDGKRSTTPLFKVDGKMHTTTVDGALRLNHVVQGIDMGLTYPKSDARLTGSLRWRDSSDEEIASVGFTAPDTFDFSLSNILGNIVLQPKDSLDVRGTLKIRGVDIATTYLTQATFSQALAGKVNTVTGKGLSTEDFTSELRRKLESISTQSISSSGTGYVTAQDVKIALQRKLDREANLSDVSDAPAVRRNLSLYSKEESNSLYFKISELLAEVIALSQDEIKGKTPEQIIALKEQKQQTVRNNLDAEKKGSAELRLSKTQNLGDLTDKTRARQNIEVYSTAEIDSMLEGKLSTEGAYFGELFTSAHKSKLEGIKTGNFAGTNAEGVSVSQAEGYVMTSAVKKELDKKAGRLLEGYSASEMQTLAANIAVYAKSEADNHFGQLGSSLQDYITHLVKQGQTTTQAQQTLRDKLDASGKSDLNVYLRKDNKLADLTLDNAEERKQACQKIGAAYAPEYQPKLEDTGWISCGGANAGTLFARQIGNIVCIQGRINTSATTSATWGVCATIPNQVSPPKYGCRQTAADFNDDHKYNRGCSFLIQASSRNILIHERGMPGAQTELHFSYMT